MPYLDISDDSKSTYRLADPGLFLFFLKNRNGEITFSLEHPEAEARIFCIFEGKSEDAFSLCTTQRHKATESKSSLLIKSVLQDSSHLHFSGNIIIEKQAQKVEASLENRNLLLGEKAHVISIPNLEILANDVKCSHAVTTSTLNPDDLFYLAARGIQKKEAEKILVDGFLNDVRKQIQTLKKRITA